MRDRLTYLSAWLAALRRKLAMIRHGRTPRPRDRHDTFPRAFTAAEAVEAEKILDHHSKDAYRS